MKLILLIHFNQSIARLDKHIQKYIGKGSGCIIDSVVYYTINISKYINEFLSPKYSILMRGRVK